ncbi:hypothetical protein EJ06DRAFT_541474 [Trichodelitschia bisporula]|uniref:Sds3-like protein n=1 Tax=Trichodelitschia bisporula TaxID=703511 RepID=A0A6G1I678_9PEZI|nr:hypothetical protein EJ06DRAFT_541474 [Trichodelitschia bisporula]
MARIRSPSPDLSRHSGSPPPPQSKRDKRRTMLSDKLNDMIASFNANLRPHYEAQVGALQVDINLILRADPYQNKPLEDDPAEIQNLIMSTVGNKAPGDQVGEQDFQADAGKLYTGFVHDVNNAQEERDINLTLLATKHQNALAELDQRYQFQVHLAHQEHRLLANTIRERLLHQVSQKKARLLKEKEQLDIGDSNAFLLHPNQFSITNPASPGGGHKRATRNTGKRGADMDESMAQENKRRRKALFEEIEGQSPAPGNSRGGDSSPFRSEKAKNAYHQYEAPAYSIDRLFTERELAMTMNLAAIATTNFLVKQNSGQPDTNGASNGQADTEEAASGSNTAADGDEEDVPPPAAPEMERTVSQSYHATRGATRNALTDLAAAATRDLPFSSVVPTYIPAVIGSKANSAPVTAAPLSQAEIEQDLAIMGRDTRGADEYNDRLLRHAVAPHPPSEYSYQAPALLLPSGEQELFGLHAGLAGGVAMSAQSSAQGHGNEAGVPMSRQGSARGGLAKQSSFTGAGGLLGVGEGGRRRGGR